MIAIKQFWSPFIFPNFIETIQDLEAVKDPGSVLMPDLVDFNNNKYTLGISNNLLDFI